MVKFLTIFLAAGGACASCAAATATNAPPVLASPSRGVDFDVGVKERLRQEYTHDVPANPGGGANVAKRTARAKDTHLLRLDNNLWGRAALGPYTFYARLANQMREHFLTHGVARKNRAYTEPDEFFLDNLYLDGQGLGDGAFDFRVGRQDLNEENKSIFGLGRLVYDGTPVDYSRSHFADMARVAWHPDADSTLDLFALYDSDANYFSWGRQRVHGRTLNGLVGGEDPGPDQWGGGLVWRSVMGAKELPYNSYVLHKRDTAHRRGAARVPEKDVTTIGTLFMPELTDAVSLELDGAGQVGERRKCGQAGGWMGVVGVDYHPQIVRDVRTYVKLSTIYYSGDRDKTDGHNDTAWDPMWGRYVSDSENFARGTHAQIAYWSNMIFSRVTLGAKFGPHHDVWFFSGPIWAAADDNVGGGGGEFKGILTKARYNYPILLRPKKARGIKRFELFGAFVAECFNPGDYYESTRPALYVRWELQFRF